MKLILTHVLLVALLLNLGAGCGKEEENMSAAAPTPSPSEQANRSAAPATARPSEGPRVVFLGDSLTAGYGLEVSQAFPTLLGQMLADEGLPIEVVNAGVSGDTTAGGLRRIDWLLRQSPDILVVGLGGNDGLRGTDVQAVEQNLRQIIHRVRDAGAEVLLLGILVPPNYGPQYTQQFRDIFPRIAEDLDVPLVPFLLEGVGGDPDLNQPDRIHPTAEGQRILARNVLPHLRELVQERMSKTSDADSASENP